MKALPLSRPFAVRLPWPLPALLAWLAAGSAWRLLDGGVFALAIGIVISGAAALAWPGIGRWRRLLIGAGFPLAVLLHALATGALPAWAWLLPCALLLLAYPLRAWRDAPLFPTPPDALTGLQALVALPAGARVLDAGCGLGHGLQALHDALPAAQIEGIEFSRPLALVARRRCGFARITRGDMWRQDWSGFDLVYLFQRPESMARAAEKAGRELRPDAWLASLEFEVPGVQPSAVLRSVAGKPVWLYRARLSQRRAVPELTQPPRGAAAGFCRRLGVLFGLSDRSTAAQRGR
ncbi:class I SAM-dependent methyltransferase [Pseudaquabacterium terrae]|uniref:class I SAM-dependent methyltransferase n=1 Tax=Pseudaquabacterium terrae TaxID=2732868 RepID=UPI001FE8EC4F|nr:class I SAM-dependent methyltransferase [Aquabacterium terrae]